MSAIKKHSPSQSQDNLPTKIRWPPRTSKSDSDQMQKAVLLDKPRKIKDLISKGVSIDIRNRDGQTALFLAAYLGKKKLVRKLLSYGAHPNARCLPQGHTALHGACYIGSVEILKLLIAAGGDLRLTDIQRQRPVDWVEFQPNIKKRATVRNFVENARFCTLSAKADGVEKEVQSRMTDFGITFKKRILKFVGRFLPSRNNNNMSFKHNRQIVSTGFGKVYFGGSGETKCSEMIGLPCVSELTNLKFECDPKAPSWICGKFSTFIPMSWSQRNASVTMKSLRQKSVQEAIPDILIAELETLTQLQHPRILMLLAVSHENNYDSLSLVFEKVSWGSLYFFLHQKGLRMNTSFATDIVIQISEALDFVHASGFLHCGISSHAIMLVGENQAKLSCFEYAIPENTISAASVLSTRHPWLHSDSHLSVLRHWLAPEILSGANHQHSQISDIYSLCSVMWELVMGEVPWKDHNLESLKILMKDCPGLHLPLHKEIIPPLWLSVLKVGLKTNWRERDLDFGEIRYMMSLAKERPAVSASGGGGGDVKTPSKVSLRSLSYPSPGIKSIKSEDVVDAANKNKSILKTTTPSSSSIRKEIVKVDVIEQKVDLEEISTVEDLVELQQPETPEEELEDEEHQRSFILI